MTAYRDYLRKLTELLAIDYNCAPDSFLQNENILTVSALNEGKRMYSSEKPFFGILTERILKGQHTDLYKFINGASGRN